jgi:glycosyltransferase involved in cell wall biosynthesis
MRERDAGRRRLRIGVDAHAIGARLTGNERFVSNLLPALRRNCEHEIVAYVGGSETHPTELDGITIRPLRTSQPLLRIPFVLPWMAKRDELDVLMVQYTAPPATPCPVVTVVHDVAFELFPEFLTRTERLWMRRTIPWSMRRAAGIVTVSEFSKREIHRLFGIDDDRITVAPNGVDPIFLDSTPRRAVVEPPFFVCVANLQPRKNLLTLIRSYRRLVDRHGDVRERLVIVGQERLRSEGQALASEAADLVRAGRVVFTGYLGDQELVGLLQQATAFAYPSVYEGFGLPPVEAMAVGLPALVSDIPVMQEVVGDAALRLPPRDIVAWSDGLHRVTSDQRLRATLVERGRALAAELTWDRSAALVLTALERAAGTTAGPR